MIATSRYHTEFGICMQLAKDLLFPVCPVLFLIPIFDVKMHYLEKKSLFAKIAEYDIHCLHRIEGSRQKIGNTN